MLKLCLCLALVFVSVACGEIPNPPENAPWYVAILSQVLGNFPEVNGWLAAILVFVMTVARAVAEIFAFIAYRTKSTEDDKHAGRTVKVCAWIAAVVGWFGVGSVKKK